MENQIERQSSEIDELIKMMQQLIAKVDEKVARITGTVESTKSTISEKF